MVPAVVTAEDTVLEVGSANGVTCEIIAAYAKEVVGVDSSKDEIGRARTKFPKLEFHLVEGTDLKQLKALRPQFSKVFVDIGGVVALPYLEPVLKQLEVSTHFKRTATHDRRLTLTTMQALRPSVIVVKSIQLYKLQEQLQRGLSFLSGVEEVSPAANVNPGALEEMAESNEKEEDASKSSPPFHEPTRRTMIKKEARVAKVTLAVEQFIERRHVPCVLYDAGLACDGGNPFSTLKPPSNFQLRAQMCQLDPKTLVKCLFLLVTAPPPGVEPKATEGALTLVRVVMPPVGYLDFDVITSRLRVELKTCGCLETQAMLERPDGKLVIQIAAARHLSLLEKGMTEEEQCSTEDLRQCALNYKICPPLGPPAEILTLVASEASEEAPLLFEIGFGRYVTVKGKDLVAAIGPRHVRVVEGLIKDESTDLPFLEP